MPYIKKLPKQQRNRNNRKRNKSDKEKLRIRLYNKAAWKKLRQAYLMQHPLCEMCLEDSKVITSSSDVHHIQSPFDEGLTDVERIGLLLDASNLMALCKYHHGLLHQQQQK